MRYEDDWEERQSRFHGYNPVFVARIHAKRRESGAAPAQPARSRSTWNQEILRAKRDAMAELRAEAEAQREARRAARALALEQQAAALQLLPETEFRRIERRAVKVFGLLRSELWSRSRSKRVAMARQFIAYWARRRTRLTLPQIGRLMSGMDHTSVLYGVKAYPAKRAGMGRTLREAR